MENEKKEEKTKKVKKLAYIKNNYCKSCEICISVCPVDALSVSSIFNSSGVHPVEVSQTCIGCGQCFYVCPDFAIEVK